MIVATLTKVVASVAMLGALCTALFVVLPRPESTNGIWLDTPLDKAQVEESDVQVVLHSDLPNLLGIYVDVSLDGKKIVTLRDNDLEVVQRGKDAKPLYVFDQIWAVGNPGEYTLDVSVSGSTDTQRSFTVTVLDEGDVSVQTAEGTSVPTPTATPTPTESVPPPVDEPSGPLVAGSVVRFQPGEDDWQSYFYLNTFSPEEATASLELRITNSLTGEAGAWQSYPCTGNTYSGTPGLYNCVISNHYLQPQASFQIDGTWMPFSVEYYGLISIDGESGYAPGGTWETARR